MGNSKEPIRLRKRMTQSGNTSLYLDIYLNGERTYEYLKLYLIPERTRSDKEKNRETLKLAEAIKSKRIVKLRNGEYGFKDDFASDTLFFDYYKMLCEKRHGEESRSNWGNWYASTTSAFMKRGRKSRLPKSRPNGYKASRTTSKTGLSLGRTTNGTGKKNTRCPETPRCRISISYGLD